MIREIVLTGATALLAFSTPLLAQDAATETLSISDGYMRAAPASAKVGAGFMTITSKGPADRLVAFRTAACSRPELHTHIHDNGVMRMRQVEAIDLPANGTAVLEPGGLHIMCMGLVTELAKGTEISATLVFEQAGEVDITLPVKSMRGMH